MTRKAEGRLAQIRSAYPDTKDYVHHMYQELYQLLLTFMTTPDSATPAPKKRRQREDENSEDNEDDFTKVKSRRKASPKAQDAAIQLTNSFAALENMEAEETEAENPAQEGDEGQPPNRSPKPPPITVPDLPNTLQFNKKIKGKITGDYKVVSTREGMKLYASNIEDFNLIKNELKQDNINFFTYQLRQERPIRVVLRRLPINLHEEDIKEALEEENFKVLSVRQLRKITDGTETKYPLYVVAIERTIEAQKIYKLTRLLHTVVKVEAYRATPGIKQCYRCQRFHHTFRECNLPTKCVICAEAHNHKTCPVRETARKDTTLLKCANCKKSGHTASSKKCEIYIQESGKLQEAHQPAQQRLYNARPVTADTSYAAAASTRQPSFTPENQTAPPCQPPVPAVNHAQLISQIINSITPIIETIVKQILNQSQHGP